jgi:hypothetical protein
MTPGTVAVPWTQVYPAAIDSGHEQLISVVKGNGLTEILATPQNFANNNQPQYGSEKFGNTSLRLYSKQDGSSVWNETDINTAFDGQGDTFLDVNHNVVNAARKDTQMAQDAQGNLFIEYSSDASNIGIDRIPAAMVADLAAGNSITPYSSTQILAPDNVATRFGVLRPQFAVGSLASDPSQTAVYLFSGDVGLPTGSDPVIWSWQGTTSDSFASSNSLWKTTNDSSDVGGAWAPMTVDGNGDLYSTDSLASNVYKLSWSSSSPAFTQFCAAPAHGTSAGLVAYTSPTDGSTTLFSLTTDTTGHTTVATTPVSGVGAGTWTFPTTPIDPLNSSIVNPLMGVDLASG